MPCSRVVNKITDKEKAIFRHGFHFNCLENNCETQERVASHFDGLENNCETQETESYIAERDDFYCPTSWPARRCPGIRAPRWSLSRRSPTTTTGPSSAELSRLPITPSRGEHTPLWKKLPFDRWTCIITAFAFGKNWLGSLNIIVFITDKRKRARKRRAKCETST